MKKFRKTTVGLLAPSVLAIALAGCTDDEPKYSEYSETRAPEVPENERNQARSEGQSIDDYDQGVKTQAGLYGQARSEQSEELATTVHRTITFAGDSTDLDNTAEQSLERMAEELDEDRPAQVIVRTVDPNDVSAGNVNRLNEERVENVKSFLEDKGVKVGGIRMDRYSGSEYTRSQEGAREQAAMGDTEGAQREQAAMGDTEGAQREQAAMGDTEDAQQGFEQEVIITIVSGADMQ